MFKAFCAQNHKINIYLHMITNDFMSDINVENYILLLQSIANKIFIESYVDCTVSSAHVIILIEQLQAR